MSDDLAAASRSAYDADEPPPWDIGRPQRAVVELAERGAFRGPVLDVGCGTGENALLLAARGLEVVGIDPALTAIERARRAAADRGLEVDLRVGSGLELDLGRRFASVLDSGVFHGFDDDDRRRYVARLAAATAPGGVYTTIVFSDREPPGWGPRRITATELRAAFADGWTELSIEPSVYEVRIRSGRVDAWRARFRRDR